MDKPLKFISPNGEEISKEELGLMFQTFLKEPETVKPIVEPPKDFREFEDRILWFEEKLRAIFFGFTYDLGSGKTLKREKSAESLVEALCHYDKYIKSRGVIIINEQLNPMGLLALVLDRDAPLVICEDVYLLGFTRDRSGLSLPQKNKIAIQAAAQVLWYYAKNKIPTIEEMITYLKNKKNPLYQLLRINRFNSRTIRNWIRKVFPRPTNLRKGHPSKNEVPESYFNNLICIPEIFREEGKVINFLKLKFAVKCLARILKSLNCPIDQIGNSEIIQFYQNPMKYHLFMFVQDWIDEAIQENGSIFDP